MTDQLPRHERTVLALTLHCVWEIMPDPDYSYRRLVLDALHGDIESLRNILRGVEALSRSHLARSLARGLSGVITNSDRIEAAELVASSFPSTVCP